MQGQQILDPCEVALQAGKLFARCLDPHRVGVTHGYRLQALNRVDPAGMALAHIEGRPIAEDAAAHLVWGRSAPVLQAMARISIFWKVGWRQALRSWPLAR